MNQSQFQKAAGLSAELAARWFSQIEAAMNEFGITAPLDQAMFIAQMGHESGGYTRLVESLNYAAENLVPTFGKHRITAQQAAALGRTATQPANQKAIANLVYGGEWGKEHRQSVSRPWLEISRSWFEANHRPEQLSQLWPRYKA